MITCANNDSLIVHLQLQYMYRSRQTTECMLKTTAATTINSVCSPVLYSICRGLFNGPVTIILLHILISQLNLVVEFSYFLERSTLVTVMVPRKIVLHLLLNSLLLSKSMHYCLNHPLST